jgi:hypothetical protein
VLELVVRVLDREHRGLRAQGIESTGD